MDFTPIHSDAARCHDAEAGPATSGRDHCDVDVSVDHNFFADATCQNEHGGPSWKMCLCAYCDVDSIARSVDLSYVEQMKIM